jgi:hypothetical protein
VSNIAQTCLPYFAQPCLVRFTWLADRNELFRPKRKRRTTSQADSHTEGDPSRDEVRYQLLSLLLAEEEAKPRKLLDG